MRERIGLRLRPSESVVVRAAADIYSAHVLAKEVNDSNREKVINQAIHDAIEIARLVERRVRSDDELV